MIVMNVCKFEQCFLSRFVFTLSDLKSAYFFEIDAFNASEYDYHKRAARLSAAVKRYKTSEMIKFVLEKNNDDWFDLTPLTVKRLTKALFGRSGSQSIIVGIFGMEGRIQRSADSSRDRINCFVELHQEDADKHWNECLSAINSVKLEYKKKYMSINHNSCT